jgi:hypothetical protein
MLALPLLTPAFGVNTVYTSGLAVTVKPLRLPPLTATSPEVKPSGASLKVKVMVAVSPS